MRGAKVYVIGTCDTKGDELRFADDPPLADPDTRTWIKSRVIPDRSAAPAAAPAMFSSDGPVGGEGFEEARAEAQTLVRQRKLAD